MKKEIKKETKTIKVPCGKLCSNCADGCIYWEPYNKNSSGRQYCSSLNSYYYPSERNGCFRFRK